MSEKPLTLTFGGVTVKAAGPPVVEQPTPYLRAERAILACFAENFEPDARMIAETLVDEDVSQGLYEGCSTELEAWFSEYENLAKRILDGRKL